MNRLPINPISKKPRAQIEHQCTALWHTCIFLTFKGRCAKCGKLHVENSVGGRLWDGHHVIGSRFKRFRWEIDCGVLLCRLPCHRWATDNPTSFLEWLESNRPEQFAWRQAQVMRADHIPIWMLRATLDELKGMETILRKKLVDRK